ncbi:RNA-guided pseudouridylation complex pseudouridine synthase subunit Cbf5 [Natronobeatus ordinarius]|uniref:RNA-guided pseudouridylation complex pseudouridine synthase subunit Cbf5 n=1 Tax=Natronobeatus ordinarius TaxID=2963433 RepID=UPI0020CE8A46|nr:RNA-guided pseudouridylation complex pseudouridine synthase subunit Cbf5 [Natronobeatus ordinarius]
MVLRGPPDDRSPADLLSFGVVNLDKPPGPSSHQVSGWLRDSVADALESADAEPIDRAAHAGTLDPKVTGCLPVMLGDATRLAPAFLEGEKEYVAVLECHGPVPTDVAAVAAEFEGEVYQKPPRKSAVSRRLRTREIHDLEVLETTDRKALLRIRCESGTYVRKLCHDLGLALGTGAHMGDLRRTATEPFDDRDLHAATDLLDALAYWLEDDDPTRLYEVVDPGERILEELPDVTIAESAAREVANGAPVYAPGVLEVPAVDRGSLVACYTPDGAAVCLGRLVGDPEAETGTVVDLERVLV